MKQCAKCGIQNSQYLSEDKFVLIDDMEYCPYCASKIENGNDTELKMEDPNQEKVYNNTQIHADNSIANIIKIIGYFIIIIGIAIGVIYIPSNVIIAISSIIGSIISGVLFLGLSEIIYLLEKILKQQGQK